MKECIERRTITDLMQQRYVWKLVAPSFVLGCFLLAVGVFAAWNVQTQQRTTSELIASEVRGMIAIEELNLEMREIRYQLNLFLRTGDLDHIRNVASIHPKADLLLQSARQSARNPEEKKLLEVASDGYGAFFDDFRFAASTLDPEGSGKPITAPELEKPGTSLVDHDLFPAVGIGERPIVPVSQDQETIIERLIRLSTHWDLLLTHQVLEPLERCIDVNEQVVEKTKLASEDAARHVTIGFLLLGLCGGVAGILWGLGMGRAIGRSIVQLHVSVRGASNRLSDASGGVTVTHHGDFTGLEVGIKELEQNVASVVEQLQQRDRELLRSEQLAQVGQLAAGLAHELRNPLMPMKMLVQAAIERGENSALRGRSLYILNEEISRLEQSIQSFLDFARPAIPEKRPENLIDIIRNTAYLVGPRCQQQSIQITVDVPQTQVISNVDRSQLRQLLLNLILNAMDAVKHGGNVSVQLLPGVTLPVDCGELRPGLASLRDLKSTCENQSLRDKPQRTFDSDTQFVLIRVIDDGDGIPTAIVDRIFEPFVTTKETGSGLGLSICKRIADMHRGKLLASNRREGGAAFSLYLPSDPGDSMLPVQPSPLR